MTEANEIALAESVAALSERLARTIAVVVDLSADVADLRNRLETP